MSVPVPQPARFDARTLIGLSLDQAVAQAARHGCKSRVVRVDGRWQTVTSDYETHRVDVAVSRGVVTGVGVG